MISKTLNKVSIKRHGSLFLFLLILIFLFACQDKTDDNSNDNSLQFDKPQSVIKNMMRGINIGNTLEPPTVGEWNNGFIKEHYFDDYKEAGFSTIRIPIRWDKHTSNIAPYSIDNSWLDLVEMVVDWGLERDLYIIINSHHDWWLVDGYSDREVQKRFENIWRQVSERFENKSPRLFFEIINEPHGLTQENINELNEKILSIIRVKNPKRIVIYSGHEWSNSTHLLSAKIPDDDYIMGYFHAYDPWEFSGKGNGVWGSENDINAIKSKFESVAKWSTNNNIPVMISEFGAVHDCDYNSRMLHYSTYVDQAILHGIAFQAWDDGGQFGIYERTARTWPEVKDILIHTYPEGPTMLKARLQTDSSVRLTWQNRTISNERIIIERKTANSAFSPITEVGVNTAEYVDKDIEGLMPIYRVIADFSSDPDMYSNPARIK